MVTYYANDTFDGPEGKDIYPIGGTNFKEEETFLLNLHSMIGYFEGFKESSYNLNIISQKLKTFYILPAISKSDSIDVFSKKLL